ncbi:hypothetical protein EE612_025940 [Oryza sativa]|nr:hypothetical protein EE612_025940 [Oryza sativa]
MGRPTTTSTFAGSRCDVESWLSADDMTGVRPVTSVILVHHVSA